MRAPRAAAQPGGSPATLGGGSSDPPRLVAAIPDLMAAVRIGEAARAAGLALDVVDGGAWAAALDGPAPAGAVVDLTAPDAIDRIASATARGVPVLAYGPHVDGDRLAAAAAAGARRVVPRGAMMQRAAALLTALVGGDGDPAPDAGGATPAATHEADDGPR